MNDKSLLAWAEFVATKFSQNADGWQYTRDTGELEHIRYHRDYTGYDAWYRRLKRALAPESKFMRSLGFPRDNFAWYKKPYYWALSRYARFVVYLRKEKHLPDGVVNGGSIITFWEEDGEYITLFGPTVGVKVIEWLRAEPENEYAKAVIAEMHRVAELSWPAETQE